MLPAAYSLPSCELDFASLQKDAHYYVHRSGYPTVLPYQYLGQAKDELGETKLIFSIPGGGRVEFRAKDIQGFREIEGPFSDEQVRQLAKQQAVEKIKETLFIYHQLLRQKYIPQKVLAANERIQVVGNGVENPARAQGVLASLESADRYLAEAGFFIPGNTRVVLTEKPLTKKDIGPVAHELYVQARGSDDWQRLIDLRAVELDKKLIYDSGVIAHERTHSIVQHNFSFSTISRTSNFYNEALADYVGAEVSGASYIGKNYAGEGKPARDLFLRQTNTPQKSFGIKSYADLHNDAHHNSLLISNFLLRLKGRIGGEAVQKILYPLWTDLSRFRAHYDANFADLVTGAVFVNDSRQRMIHDFEYFLAVLARTSMESPLKQDIIHMIDLAAREMGIDPNRLAILAYKIQPSEMRFTPIRSEEISLAKNNLNGAKQLLYWEIGVGSGVAGSAGIASYYFLDDSKK